MHAFAGLRGCRCSLGVHVYHSCRRVATIQDNTHPAVFTNEAAAAAAAHVHSGDEHGKLLWPQGQWQVPAELPPLGAKLLLQPGHCDPTANLYDCIVAFRKEHGVLGVWPVARGPGS